MNARMTMQTTAGPNHYLVFITDKRRFVLDAGEFEADDDEGAFDAATALYQSSVGAGFEIWKDGEVLARYEGAWRRLNS